MTMVPENQNEGIFRLLVRLWAQLEKRRRSQFLLLLLLMLFSAFSEVVTLGVVLPFLGVLADPDAVFKYSIAQSFAHLIGVSSGGQMLLPLTLLFIGVATVSAGARILLLWVSSHLTQLVGVDLGSKVYLLTLYQPYHVHLMRNSSVVIDGITHKVENSIFTLSMSVTLVTACLLIISVAATLFMINPVVASIAVGGFGAGYAAVGMFFRRLLKKNGEIRAKKSTLLVQCIQEGVGSIREVLLDGSQSVYGDGYKRISYPLQLAVAKNNFISGSPRYVMEMLGITMIVALAYSLSQQPGGMSDALPLLGALALAAQRILPNIHQVFSSWAGILGNQASLRDTLDLLEQPLPEYALKSKPEPLVFSQRIQVQSLTFRYSEKAPWVLSDIAFDVEKGSKIGIVGSTGSGKSTMMDIIMGLLEPVDGCVLVDGASVHGQSLKAWQRRIAHVPQSVFLTDGTVVENIALGVPLELIDMKRVVLAAQQAQLADFFNGLDLGFQTMVGERGVRLSGGQRQRIGIARALYKQASVIVFDEATSSLDNATERSVMDAIGSLSADLTVFLIAHRLSTVRDCDNIIVLDHGHMVGQGSYDYLLENSPAFKKIAGVSMHAQ